MNTPLDQSYTLATINVNAIQNNTKLLSLSAFIRMLDLDVVCMQEVSCESFEFPGYQAIYNINERNRGTAILVRRGIRISGVHKSDDSRIISITLQNTVTVVNIYAPSGSNNRGLREDFFNSSIPPHVLHHAPYLIIAGDFNSVIDARDSTGSSNFSPNLKRLVQVKDLTDCWRMFNAGVDYTFVRGQSMSRIDAIFVNRPVVNKLRYCRIQVNCFSDHKAVVMRLVLPVNTEPSPRAPWKLNNVLLTPENIQELSIKWSYWKRSRQNYPSWVDWWVDFAKKKLVSFFKWKRNQKYQSYNDTMGFYYTCLQRAYVNHQVNDCTPEINRIKAIMLRKEAEFRGSFSINSHRHLTNEKISIFQLDDQRKRQSASRINILNNGEENISEQHEIDSYVYNHYRSLFSAEEVNIQDNFQPIRTVPQNLEANNNLMEPITEEEVHLAIKTAAANKSPGKDGLTREFFLRAWTIIKTELVEILNEMMNGRVREEQLEGIIVLVKKNVSDNTISSYRPISLLNVDYKILSRILKERLTKVTPCLLSNHQKCSNGSRNIFEATCLIRDEIGETRRMGQNGLVIACDLSNAFDRVSYDFLIQTLRRMGINEAFVNFLTITMRLSKSQVSVNGRLSEPFNIHRSVRQGDPLSMVLFVLYLQPLLDYLVAICNGNGEIVTGYADDISIILKDPSKVRRIINAFREFEVVSGAKLNLRKTIALKLGEHFDTPEEIVVKDQVKILGVIYKEDLQETMQQNWDSLWRSMNALLWINRSRKIDVRQRVWLLNTYICSKLWYMSSIFPLPGSVGKRVKQQISTFIWHGVQHRVRYEQIIKNKRSGGLGLHCPIIKSKSLLLNRFLETKTELPYQEGYTRIAHSRREIARIPPELPHVKEIVKLYLRTSEQILANPSAGIIYNDLLNRLPDNRIELIVGRNWVRVWKNVLHKDLSSEEKTMYYLLCNGKMGHNALLCRENRRADPNCEACGAEETISHKFSACGRVEPLWQHVGREVATLRGRRVTTFASLQYPELQGARRSTIGKILKIFIRFIMFLNDTSPDDYNVINLINYLTMYT